MELRSRCVLVSICIGVLLVLECHESVLKYESLYVNVNALHAHTKMW